MKSLIVIAALAGCSTQADDYPVVPGSGLAPPSSASPGMLSGRVCIVDDPTNLSDCAPTGAGDLTVSLAGATVKTAADGSFAIPDPAAGDAVFSVTGAGMVPTRMVMSSTASGDASIPLLRADLFARMMAANGIVPSTGSGSILGTVIRDGVPVTGVTVTATPPSAFPSRFDGDAPASWTLNGTGARGVIWVPGVTAGLARLSFRDAVAAGETLVEGIPVINGGITIVDAILP